MAKENIKIRELTISDFMELHEMYDSLSNQSRPYFNLYWLGLKRRIFKWYLVQLGLFLSTIPLWRKLLYHVYPYVIFLSKVAVDNSKIVAYGFLIVRNRLRNRKFSVELGVAVRDNYQGKGIGKTMVRELISFTRTEPISEIYLTTRLDNVRAHELYKDLGFKDTEVLKSEVEWKGKKFDMYKMILDVKNEG